MDNTDMAILLEKYALLSDRQKEQVNNFIDFLLEKVKNEKLKKKR
jgi:hypothetical protein